MQDAHRQKAGAEGGRPGPGPGALYGMMSEVPTQHTSSHLHLKTTARIHFLEKLPEFLWSICPNNPP